MPTNIEIELLRQNDMLRGAVIFAMDKIRQIRAVGVGLVWVAEACTMCNEPMFYSYRRGKDTGRMVSAIGVLE